MPSECSDTHTSGRQANCELFNSSHLTLCKYVEIASEYVQDNVTKLITRDEY